MEPATALITPHPKANLGDLLRHHWKLLELQESGDSLKLVRVHALESSIPLCSPGEYFNMHSSCMLQPCTAFPYNCLLLPTEPEPRHACSRHTIHHGYFQASEI